MNLVAKVGLALYAITFIVLTGIAVTFTLFSFGQATEDPVLRIIAYVGIIPLTSILVLGAFHSVIKIPNIKSKPIWLNFITGWLVLTFLFYMPYFIQRQIEKEYNPINPINNELSPTPPPGMGESLIAKTDLTALYACYLIAALLLVIAITLAIRQRFKNIRNAPINAVNNFTKEQQNRRRKAERAALKKSQAFQQKRKKQNTRWNQAVIDRQKKKRDPYYKR